MAIGTADRGPEVVATLRGLLPNRQVELGTQLSRHEAECD